MNNERKQIIVQALIKLVQSAPKVQSPVQTPVQDFYLQGIQNQDVSAPLFNAWIDYVNSVLDVTYEYTGLNHVLEIKMNVTLLSTQNELYIQRIFKINDQILSLAQMLLQYY